MRSQSSTGSSHRIETARSARLVFANATMLPNWTISGSFSYCGAPPEIVITVAMVTALSTVALSVAAYASTHSWGWGAPAMSAIEYSTVSETTATSMKFARLKASLIARWWEPSTSATADPTSTAARYSPGFRKKEPMTAGNSLSENEWVSRRKWTSTTFSSASANAAAM